MAVSVSVVIATRNRREPLRECLESLAAQTRPPSEVILVDASDAAAAEFRDPPRELPFRVVRLHAAAPSAAKQRNQGIDAATGDIVVFLDDDVVLEPQYLAELIRVLDEDPTHRIGGVSGTIVNQTYAPPSRLNRAALRVCLGPTDGDLAGRLAGPAVNFLPADGADRVQRVEWLNTTGVAYRREALQTRRFPEFDGYSVMEDVHLSASVGREYALMNTTRARLFHHDLGRRTHRDWAALGESHVVHRHQVMTQVLGRTRVLDYARLLLYELGYCTLAAIWRGNRRCVPALLKGRLRGAAKVLQ